MLTDILLPAESKLVIDSIETEEQTIAIGVFSTDNKGICPNCQTPSHRVHSRSKRQPADLSLAGKSVCLHLFVRRFFCDNTMCQKTTFCERVPTFVKPYARRTNRLAEWQRQVGFTTSGEAGARLLASIGMPTSPDTLLRLIRGAQDPDFITPRVLGVDDWALCRGHCYGTILVDLETHQPVDLLPQRSAESLAKWLKEHPGVEIISRDRGKEYIKGATDGAPEAIQVADRWHLLKNLSEVLQRLLEEKPQCLKTAACGNEESQTPEEKQQNGSVIQTEKPTASSSGSTVERLSQAEKISQARRAKREKRHQMVCELYKIGFSIREISRRTKLHRRTVTKYIKAPQCPMYPRGVSRGSKLDPYKELIYKRLQAGCYKATTIFREIKKLGFDGSYPLVARFLTKAKTSEPLAQRTPQNQIAPLSPRRGAWFLFQREEKMTDEDKQTLERMKGADETITQAHSLAQRFVSMIVHRQPEALLPWLCDAAQSGIDTFKHFAQGLQQDISAVICALHLPWSQGPVEGQVNRLKLIKRQMYGRAKFDLLKKRVLGGKRGL